MRRSWLAPAAVAAAALSVPMAGAAQAAPLTGQHMSIPRPIIRRHVITFNQRVAAYVKSLEGTPYAWGGTSPSGFDCSGLTQYVYRHFGKHIERTAEAQFLQFRRISKARARRGDLVFFHVDSDPNSTSTT